MILSVCRIISTYKNQTIALFVIAEMMFSCFSSGEQSSYQENYHIFLLKKVGHDYKLLKNYVVNNASLMAGSGHQKSTVSCLSGVKETTRHDDEWIACLYASDADYLNTERKEINATIDFYGNDDPVILGRDDSQDDYPYFDSPGAGKSELSLQDQVITPDLLEWLYEYFSFLIDVQTSKDDIQPVRLAAISDAFKRLGFLPRASLKMDSDPGEMLAIKSELQSFIPVEPLVVRLYPVTVTYDQPNDGNKETPQQKLEKAKQLRSQLETVLQAHRAQLKFMSLPKEAKSLLDDIYCLLFPLYGTSVEKEALPIMAEVKFWEGVSLYREFINQDALGNLTLAIGHFLEALNMGNEELAPQVRNQLASSYFDLGNVYKRRGLKRDANSAYLSARLYTDISDAKALEQIREKLQSLDR